MSRLSQSESRNLERTVLRLPMKCSEWTAKMHLLSGGKNSIKWVSDGASTALYWPCIVVRRPAKKAVHYLTGAGDSIHPAFVGRLTNYDQYWMSKYPAHILSANSKTILLSLPGFDGMSNLLTRAQIETIIRYRSYIRQSRWKTAVIVSQMPSGWKSLCHVSERDSSLKVIIIMAEITMILTRLNIMEYRPTGRAVK